MNGPSNETSKPEGVEVWRVRRAVVFAAAQQVVAILFAALLLDGGQMMRLFTIAAIGSWAFMIAIIVRGIVARRTTPICETDVQVITYSFWLAAGLVLLLCPLMMRVL